MRITHRALISSMVAVSLLGTMLLGAGCSKTEDEAETTTSETTELSGTIRFATWGSESEIETNRDVIAAFEEANPNCTVELEYIPADYETKIDTLIAGGAAPDVIYGHPYQLRKWYALGALTDLTDLYETKGFNDDSVYNTSFYKNFEYEGDKVGTINGQDIILLYYNKALFDAAGVEYPSETWTWDDFIAAAQKLTITENSKTTQYGVSLGANYTVAEVFIWSHGGAIVDDTYANDAEIVVDSPETVTALQLMQDIVNEYKISPTPESAGVFGGSFEAGNVAMKFDGAWAPVFLKDVEGLDWDMIVVPKGPEGRRTAVLYAGYGVYKDSENPKLAEEFAAFMQSYDGQKILAETGLITVIHKDISEAPEVLGAPGMPPGNAYRISGVADATWRDAAPLWWHEALDKGFTPELQALLNGSQDAQTTAANMQKLMSGIRDQNQ
ncbi:MAG: sugar ABC transporter substrate-binding protein [Coriobacteriia bacterium]|nr:sugar ABC transporter substrate-binding protein [Coriobacteriia bacterium]